MTDRLGDERGMDDPRRQEDDRSDFDVIVVGAGPAGCTAALAQAKRGRRVLVLEANANAADRLAGEWLHPRAVATLAELGVALPDELGDDTGRGFAVFPDDGSDPVELPYSGGSRGWSGEHRGLVDRLREAAAAHPAIELRFGARVQSVDAPAVVVRSRSGTLVFRAPLVVGADGRTSVVRRALGLAPETTTRSRMAGLRLRECDLPVPGFGHVFLGGPGPILAYRITKAEIRLCIDTPLTLPSDPATIFDLYVDALPSALRPAFEHALTRGELQWAANQTRPRRHAGREGLVLIGDAAGFSHPLTALGMTAGILDAVSLAQAKDFASWVDTRREEARVPELLASVLYDVFRSDAESAFAIRREMWTAWRRDARMRARTMGFLAAEPASLAAFSKSFLGIAVPAFAGLGAAGLRRRDPAQLARSLRELGRFAAWLLRAWRSGRVDPAPRFEGEAATGGHRGDRPPDSRPAIERATAALLALQGQPPPGRVGTARPAGEDEPRRASPEQGDPASAGGFEGEVVWCALLSAQYTIFCHLSGVGLSPQRRARLLLQFERTRDRDGLWGLHPLSPPYLFTTTLVYVAARLLGVAARDPLLRPAHAFIRREGVEAIPSWGKLWLAMLGLYDWRGVPPVVPDLFALPESWPVHPSKLYCHTRQIYLAMSVLYARKPRAAEERTLTAIRQEIWPAGMTRVRWRRARRRLRTAEVATPPGLALRGIYELGALFERFHSAALRARVVEDLEAQIAWDLSASDHTALSPVSGMLGLLALSGSPRRQPELKRGLERLEAWIFEDDVEGLRVAGARSASWDTAFALQTLGAAATVLEADSAHPLQSAMDDARSFLLRQQITTAPQGFEAAHRLDPRGGFCFAHGWHGWPVSDCTAEAIDGLLAGGRRPDEHERARLSEAVRFVLRCRNADGGFGSYEARRTRIGLEWLNPAELFGDSMTEHSYVECTASCLSALRHVRAHVDPTLHARIDAALEAATDWLRRHQRSDGAWPGVWGVGLIYGTTFAVRGLVAAGARANDPALRRATRFLLERQRADGGFSERPEGCLDGRFHPGDESQVIQTAWALLALVEAGCSDWESVARAAEFLIERLPEDGRWPRQWPAGVFFRTALLEYDLYRQVFPIWALARYEERRRRRARVADAAARARAMPSPDCERDRVRSERAIEPAP